MLELELTYLVKHLPTNLQFSESKELLDLYLPVVSKHPKLRLRKKGDTYTMTKKSQPDPNDASKQIEENIKLSKEEFLALSKVESRKVHKIRYYYDYEGHTAEVDVFQGELSGLVLVDFEFTSEEEKVKFQMPDFCLVDVTQEEFIAGGMLCGKKYGDIEESLNKFKYKKITSHE